MKRPARGSKLLSGCFSGCRLRKRRIEDIPLHVEQVIVHGLIGVIAVAVGNGGGYILVVPRVSCLAFITATVLAGHFSGHIATD